MGLCRGFCDQVHKHEDVSNVLAGFHRENRGEIRFCIDMFPGPTRVTVLVVFPQLFDGLACSHKLSVRSLINKDTLATC